MRYLLLLYPAGYENADPGAPPDPQVLRARMEFTAALKKNDILVEAHAVHPPALSARIRPGADGPIVEKGPFDDVSQTLGAYWVINAASLDEAIDVATTCPSGPDDHIEIRRFLTAEDFR